MEFNRGVHNVVDTETQQHHVQISDGGLIRHGKSCAVRGGGLAGGGGGGLGGGGGGSFGGSGGGDPVVVTRLAMATVPTMASHLVLGPICRLPPDSWRSAWMS